MNNFWRVFWERATLVIVWSCVVFALAVAAIVVVDVLRWLS